MIGGLLLALLSAALINLGFLLQHRALGRVAAGAAGAASPGGLSRLRRSLKDPMWLSGQALGWLGFGVQIVAVAIAPLALVQAFAAGGLALSVPLAAGLFRHRVTRGQALAVLIMAAGLAVLPIGLSAGADHLQTARLIALVAVGSAAGAGVAWTRAPMAWAAAAGIFYGLADAGIKAISVDWHGHGLAGVPAGWVLVAAAGTFAGFVCFQAALEGGDAVPGISLMTAGTALVALACGLLAFGESLGANAAAGVLHGLGIAAVLAVVPALAAAHTAIVETGHTGDERPAPRPRPLAAIGRPR